MARSVAVALVTALAALPSASETYRGITVAPEHRCAAYDRDAYRYPQSVEDRIIQRLGGIHGPYTGRCFASKRETDIEHMVAVSEAHDSGMCGRSAAEKRAFARDLANLTLAGPSVNRHQKRDKDVADWVPARNVCWFVTTTLEVRRKYGLTIDEREARAAEALLARCESTTLQVGPCEAAPTPAPATAVSSAAGDPSQWDDNGNGQITCAEARRHGIAPVHRGHPAYPLMRDGDRDGVVCE